jgi:hypothetical protein
MGRVFALATLVITGVIIADILTHPGGVNAASSGFNTLTQNSFNALLGGGNPGGQ